MKAWGAYTINMEYCNKLPRDTYWRTSSRHNTRLAVKKGLCYAVMDAFDPQRPMSYEPLLSRQVGSSRSLTHLYTVDRTCATLDRLSRSTFGSPKEF